MRLLICSSQVRIRDVAEFLLIRGLFLNFLIALDSVAFCRVPASVCEAKYQLCVD